MIRNLRIFSLYTVLLLAISSILFSCKKKDSEEVQPENATALKSKVVGKWQLVKAVTIEYDASGQVVRREDFSGTTPIPVYDFQQNDVLYLTDYRGEKTFDYMLSVTPERRSRIVLEGDEDYDITLLNKTDMKWFRERRATEDQPGTVRRAVVEIEFKKL